ncbi:uncharacterized protein LOC144602897 [Rhinoraja longicauda]
MNSWLRSPVMLQGPKFRRYRNLPKRMNKNKNECSAFDVTMGHVRLHLLLTRQNKMATGNRAARPGSVLPSPLSRPRGSLARRHSALNARALDQAFTWQASIDWSSLQSFWRRYS